MWLGKAKATLTNQCRLVAGGRKPIPEVKIITEDKSAKSQKKIFTNKHV